MQYIYSHKKGKYENDVQIRDRPQTLKKERIKREKRQWHHIFRFRAMRSKDSESSWEFEIKKESEMTLLFHYFFTFFFLVTLLVIFVYTINILCIEQLPVC